VLHVTSNNAILMKAVARFTLLDGLPADAGRVARL
jgi:hypothetical protein